MMLTPGMAKIMSQAIQDRSHRTENYETIFFTALSENLGSSTSIFFYEKVHGDIKTALPGLGPPNVHSDK
jgi:hypothetical protein